MKWRAAEGKWSILELLDHLTLAEPRYRQRLEDGLKEPATATRGILAWHSRASGKLEPLPGADDPRYVHTNAVWSPDGKYLYFARAAAQDPYPAGVKLAARALDPNETQVQFDLYRIPFNGAWAGRRNASRARRKTG